MSEQGIQNSVPALPFDPPEGSSPIISERYSRNREIMLRYMENQSIDKIARHVNLTPTTVRNILNSPLVAAEIERLSKLHSEQVVERIKGLSDEAVTTCRDTMRGGLDSPSELQWKASRDLLDRNPELQKKSDGAELAHGLGEEIIRQIARKLHERQDVKDEVIEIRGQDTGAGAALGEGTGERDYSGNRRNDTGSKE